MGRPERTGGLQALLPGGGIREALMAPIVTWGSIELLHNVTRTLNYLAALPPDEGQQPLPKVTYRAKVKLHGANCGVQVDPHDPVAQSRETILTPDADFKGFARWMVQQRAWFCALAPDIVVFGEWCGPGVEPGMAISLVPQKQFVVFALQVGRGEEARVIYDPAKIHRMLNHSGVLPSDIHVIPWMDDVEFTVDYADPASLQAAADYLNGVVASVEREDPWVKSTFGISGLGEGVVLYPVKVVVNGVDVPVPTDPDSLLRWMFKAKGDKHRTTRQKVAVQVSAEVASGIEDFAAMVVTEARLAQGLSVACGGSRDPKLTGKFLQWIAADVQKESVAELETSGLTWDQVKGAVQARARAWYLAK